MISCDLEKSKEAKKPTVQRKGNHQRDLGVRINSSRKVATHVDRVVNKAHGVLAFVGQGNEYKSQEVMKS